MADKSNSKVVRVMSGLALEVAVNRWLKPQFEAETGLVLEMDWRPTAAIMKSIEAGERADMVIAISDSMDRLVTSGIVRAETRSPLADAVLGVGVASGAPRPDVSTLEAFKAAMVGARGVAYSQAGASGIYFAKLIDQLGIGDAVRAKGVTIPMGFTGEKVVSGEAELAIQQVSELMTVAGIDVAGPFPPEIQVASRFDAAVFTEAANAEGARRLLALLTSPAADTAYRNGGLVSRLVAA